MEFENAAVRRDVSSASAAYAHAESTAEISATAPGDFKVIRRNGKVTSFDGNKIRVALTKAFLAVEGSSAAASTRIHQRVDDLTDQILGAQAVGHEASNILDPADDSLVARFEDYECVIDPALNQAFRRNHLAPRVGV